MPQHYGGTFGRAWLLHRLACRIYGRAERVVAISRKTSIDVHELLDIPFSRIDIIPHGLIWEGQNQSSEDDVSALDGLGLNGRPYVFYAGYADYRKNAEGMMAALAHARKSLDVDLVWAGSLPKDQRRRVLKLARQHRVSDHVKLIGFVSDKHLAALYRHSLAHIFISRLEGFGYSVAEAMAAGCPVIVARGSGSDEVADFAGALVDAEDGTAAGDQIVKIGRDPEYRKVLVRKGLQRAQAFNIRDMARNYVESYLRVPLTNRR